MNILIVDNESVRYAELSHELSVESHFVMTAHTCKKVRVLLREYVFDAVIYALDQESEKCRGLISKILEFNEDTKIIGTLARKDYKILRDAVNCGMYRIVEKPVNIESLITLIRSIEIQQIKTRYKSVFLNKNHI